VVAACVSSKSCSVVVVAACVSSKSCSVVVVAACVSSKSHSVCTGVVVAACVSSKSCSECIEASLTIAFQCQWCPSVGRCSDGLDRRRQEWQEQSCDKNVCRVLLIFSTLEFIV